MRYKNYPSRYRKYLDDLYKFKGFKNADYFYKVKGFIPRSLKIIGPPDTAEKQINCYGYAFGTNSWYEKSDVIKLISNKRLREVKEPKKGDIILYIGAEKPFYTKHSGIYLGNGKVRSKWANGPVFEHEIFNVPFSYGNKVKFYRKTKKEF